MITRKMEDKFQELKCYFNTILAEQQENPTTVFNSKRSEKKYKMKLTSSVKI